VKPRISIALALLSTTAILFLTLRPSGTTLPPGWSFTLISGDTGLAEFFQNILLFMPLGATLTLAGVKPRRGIALGALLSFAIEFAQQWIPGRDPNGGDILCNMTGTALGALLVVTAPVWLWTPPRRSAWQALGTALVAVLTWAGTGILLRPSFPPLPYRIVTTPDFPTFSKYQGEVAQVNPGISTLQIVATAPPYPPGHTTPLIAVLDQHDRKVLMLSMAGNDFTLRYYSLAVRLTLEQLDLRLRGVMRAVAPGDTFTAATWHDSSDICLRMNATRRCGLGYTIGDGWKLIFYPEGRPSWQLTIISMLWIAGSVIGVGYWAARSGGGEKGGGEKGGGKKGGGEKGGGEKGGGEKSGGEGRRGGGVLAVVIVVFGLLLVPAFTELKATPLSEWLGAVSGILVGWWFGAGDAVIRDAGGGG
jgi:uncharacterized membrane protein YgcG